jgi:ADP-heptose:LPS heptosyltransferase/predicted SAM-dependent methyltransferase
MTWKADGPQGSEAMKVRFDLVPYARGRAIDLGCGESKVFPSFLGVDNCKDNLLFGARIKPDMAVETVERLPIFADGSFDCAFSSHTLEHIEDHEATLAEWWRLVKVGGTLIVYLPHADHYPRIGQPGANPDHKHDFVPEDIVRAMERVADLTNRGWDLVVNETRTARDEYSFLQIYRKLADPVMVHSYNAPPPVKTLALVRLGAFGDALWLSSVLPALKAQGYHITVYTQDQGELVLRHDPSIDRIITMPDYLFTEINLVAYWLHEQTKYDRFINLVGSVESRLLPTAKDFQFYWSDEVRQRVMNVNYLETVHDWCGVPYRPAVKFHATEDESRRARSRLADLRGPVVVLNVSGSGQFKWWPHGQELLERLDRAGIAVVVLGDMPGPALTAPSDRVLLIGKTWPMRDALAFAQLADVVVGTESAIVNAVSCEPMLKIVLLSHSSETNLTRDWPETISFATQGLACHPCHRIHQTMDFCTQDRKTLAAACQASIKAEAVADQVIAYLEWKSEQGVTAEVAVA